MLMNLQPQLSNNFVTLQPLKESDFEELFKVAADPLIWEQHPNNDRYKRDVFQRYFNGAMESGGAFLILDKKDNSIIGCTRFYEYSEEDNSVAIGFTFIDRAHWGNGYNSALKKLMIDYALQHVKNIYFHVGLTNYRSQKAVEKLGAVKVAEDDKITYLIC
jgi:RimJ/RimL family protein N-acetyltransferase